MKTETKQNMYKQILKHGEQLKDIFNLQSNTDAVALCKKLRKLEAEAIRYTEACCNGDLIRFRGRTIEFKDLTEEIEDNIQNNLLSRVNRLLDNENGSVPVFLNLDPRGYAFKIKSEYVSKNVIKIERDLGGYGIIAPEFKG